MSVINFKSWFKFVVIIVHVCKFIATGDFSVKRSVGERKILFRNLAILTENGSYCRMLRHKECCVLLNTIINLLKFIRHLH